MDDIDDKIDRMLEEAFSEAERTRKELDAAHDSGKEIIQVVCDTDTKRGDIIEIVPLDAEDSEEGEMHKAKVVICHELTSMDPETGSIHSVNYAWCYILKDSDITTEEDFAALYADREAADNLLEAPPEALGEAAVEQAPEEVDSTVCSCGANREMCERNQNVFGGHLE